MKEITNKNFEEKITQFQVLIQWWSGMCKRKREEDKTTRIQCWEKCEKKETKTNFFCFGLDLYV